MANTGLDNYRLGPFMNIEKNPKKNHKQSSSKTISAVYKIDNYITIKLIILHKFNDGLKLEILINVTHNNYEIIGKNLILV